MSPDKKTPAKDDDDLDRIITLQEAARLSSLSPDSWRRNHDDKIIDLRPRRQGVRKRHALFK